MPVPPFPVYLFDVDGTLLDSARDICGAVQTVLAKTRANDVPFEFLRNYVGHHLIDMFRDVLPELSEEEHWTLIHEYRAIYPERGHRMTRPYDGVTEALAALGGRKSTATTKSTQTARLVLEKFGLAPHFEHVQGTDGFPSKPAPDVIHKSFEILGVRPEDCLLVGDAGPDMEAGRRAGVKICAVRWGYGNHAEMARWEPDYWIEHPSELLG
ncbi:MAG: HAD family hydrolase [Bryobacteraceae bacterium]